MTSYKTSDVDWIKVTAGESQYEFSDENDNIVVHATHLPDEQGAEGDIYCDQHQEKLQQIFEDRAEFNIVIKPSGEEEVLRYGSCVAHDENGSWKSVTQP